ncbi:MAG: zinc dependent phospholipase C family protein [Pseudomonadota bacterium]
MSLLERVIVAHKCRSMHHYIVVDALSRLSGDETAGWKDVFLFHAHELLKGAKAPDAEFKDFKNHVLHVAEGGWGGAQDAATEWYARAVAELRAKKWAKAAYAIGVLSHYYADPCQPFHTGQTEEEGVIHRALEWSIVKSRARIMERVEASGYPAVHAGDGPGFVADMVYAGAEGANRHYQTFIDHYDFEAGRANPQEGLDDTLIEAAAEQVAYATSGVAALISRAVKEAGVAAPKVNLTLPGYIAALDIPVRKLVKALDDAADRHQIEKMYAEYKKTGKVVKTLPDDDKAIRALHARDVLRVPLKALNARPIEPIGAKHVPAETPDPDMLVAEDAIPSRAERRAARKAEADAAKKAAADAKAAEAQAKKDAAEAKTAAALKAKEDAAAQKAADAEAKKDAEAAKKAEAEARKKAEADAAAAAKAKADAEKKRAADEKAKAAAEKKAAGDKAKAEAEAKKAAAAAAAEQEKADAARRAEAQAAEKAKAEAARKQEAERAAAEESKAKSDADAEAAAAESVRKAFRPKKSDAVEAEPEQVEPAPVAPPAESLLERPGGRAGRLTLDDPLASAPSIGRKTAKRLSRAGLVSVGDLMICDPEETAEMVEANYIDADKIRDWQDQVQLVMDVPGLRTHDVQVLVGAGIRSADQLAGASARDLFLMAMEFLITPEGERIAGDEADLLDEDEIEGWIDLAQKRAA